MMLRREYGKEQRDLLSYGVAKELPYLVPSYASGMNCSVFAGGSSIARLVDY